MNNPFKTQSHIVDIMFTISLFCVFAISGLSVIMLGANIYEGIVEDMDSNYTSRTCLSYLRSKIRQNDQSDSITVKKTPNGSNALVLTQRFYENSYETWIYAHNNSLNELFIKSGNQLDLESGQAVLSISQFNVAIAQNNLVKIEVTDTKGESHFLFVNLQSGTNMDIIEVEKHEK